MVDIAEGEFAVGIWDYGELVGPALQLYGRESGVFEVSADDVELYRTDNMAVGGRMTVMAGRPNDGQKFAIIRATPTNPVDTSKTTVMPGWVSDGLLDETIEVWQTYSRTTLTRDDAIQILKSVGRLFEGMGVD